MDDTRRIMAGILAVCVAVACFFGGKAVGENKISEEQENLQELNRSSIENVSKVEGKIYVIGHRSPDSDTVCSAIAYANFLNELGYDAEPRIASPINNETKFILEEAGVEVPPLLEDASGENIFLVDHSEYAQSAPGMKDAYIVGVLDHHGVGTLNIGQQVVYDARPIGATATIVWLDYMNYGIEIDSSTAYILLGAVLSDTYGLGSSTVTEADRQAVAALAEIAGVTDTDELYKNIHMKAMSYEGMTDEEIFFSDYKEYEASGVTFGIGLVNAYDEEAAVDLGKRIKAVLPEAFDKKGIDLMYASIGIRENGMKTDYIIPANERSEEVFKEAFPDYDEYDGTGYFFRSGLGRKTKFVPDMTDFLGAHPQE